MNARGQRSQSTTIEALTSHVNHAGRTAPLSHKQLGRRTGLHERQQQRHTLALEHAGKIQTTRINGYANTYRVLLPWVLPMIEGEARAADAPAAASVAAAPTSPPRRSARPWLMGEHLDHHPTL